MRREGSSLVFYHSVLGSTGITIIIVLPRKEEASWATTVRDPCTPMIPSYLPHTC